MSGTTDTPGSGPGDPRPCSHPWARLEWKPGPGQLREVSVYSTPFMNSRNSS